MKINKKQGWMIGGGIAIAAIAVAAGLHIHYSGRWYPGSKIDQVDVGGMTYEESVQKIEDSIQSYKLKIKARDDGSMELTGKEIDLELAGEDEIKAAYDQQHEKSVLTSWMGDKNTKTKQLISYSKDKIEDAVKDSDLVTGDNGYKIIKPENATVQYSKKKKYGVLKGEVEGNTLNQEKFADAIADSVEELSSEIDITDTKAYPEVYQVPSLRKDDNDLKEMQ